MRCSFNQREGGCEYRECTKNTGGLASYKAGSSKSMNLSPVCIISYTNNGW